MVLIAHRQVVPTPPSWSRAWPEPGAHGGTTRTGSRVTRARSRELALEPSEVMSLATGEAATIVLGDLGLGADHAGVLSRESSRQDSPPARDRDR